MPTRSQFFSPQYIIQQSVLSQQVGNHSRAISLLQAFIDSAPPNSVPLQIVVLYLKSLIHLNENLCAFNLLTVFTQRSYLQQYSDSDFLQFIYLDLFMNLTGFYQNSILEELKNEQTLVQFREIFVKFISLQKEDSETYEKLYNRFKFLHNYVLMQLQINTTQDEGNKMQALFTNVDFHSPILIQYYIQNLIHVKALDEFHLQKLIKMFNNSKSKINIDFTVTNETGYQFNAQQIIIEFKHTSNLQKLLKANVKIVQNTKTYAEMKEILELMLKSVVQAAQHFIKQQKQYSGFVAFWCGKELSQIGKNAESKLKQDFYMEGHLEIFKAQIAQISDKYCAIFDEKHELINSREQFGHIYTENILFENINAQMDEYVNNTELSNVLINFQRFELNFDAIDSFIRKRIAEIYFQTAVQLIKINSTAQAVQYLEMSRDAFPMRENYLLSARLQARSGKEKEARDIMEQWDRIIEGV
ncbi:Conserved_hypothetical protein [Hexamita inflata]|uniref:Uncharacterized protein n=1 Tax=Hexamita inflata TaxID=28002 RepID=A0AA86UDX8_9EUKA|nr:Conserved hypothetical protein [Hexamita inflata]